MSRSGTRTPRLRRWYYFTRPEWWLFCWIGYSIGRAADADRGWFAVVALSAGLAAVIGFGVWWFRRWRALEAFPARVHETLPAVRPSPPFFVPNEELRDLRRFLAANDARVIEIDAGEAGFEPLAALHRAAGAPSFVRPTRENLRNGKVLGRTGWRFCAILWLGAEAFAEREPAAFAETLADLSELRAFAMPGRQIELFLAGAATEATAAASAATA